jgi:hypothetical protein
MSGFSLKTLTYLGPLVSFQLNSNTCNQSYINAHINQQVHPPLHRRRRIGARPTQPVPVPAAQSMRLLRREPAGEGAALPAHQQRACGGGGGGEREQRWVIEQLAIENLLNQLQLPITFGNWHYSVSE